jgi:hypothetical protein
MVHVVASRKLRLGRAGAALEPNATCAPGSHWLESCWSESTSRKGQTARSVS